jgi:hypothetical protein
VQAWITSLEAPIAYITPGRPSENGYIEGFHARLRDEFFSIARSSTLYRKATVLLEAWCANTIRSGRIHRSAVGRQRQRFWYGRHRQLICLAHELLVKDTNYTLSNASRQSPSLR